MANRAAGRPRRAPCAADFALGAVLLAAIPLAQHALAAGAGPGAGDPGVLLVQAAGETRAVPLGRDADYSLAGPAGTTVVRIRAGCAWIAEAPCRDRLCVRMGRVEGPGRALVCMPNRIVVRARGEAGATGVDAIAR